MIQYIKLNNAAEWTELVNLACQFDSDISLHSDSEMVDAKSLLNVLAMDHDKPIHVVTEDARFLRAIRAWAVGQPA